MTAKYRQSELLAVLLYYAWRVRLSVCRGDTRLLQRSAHGCTSHPKIANALLLFGGWGIDCASQSDDFAWLNDLALLRLDT